MEIWPRKAMPQYTQGGAYLQVLFKIGKLGIMDQFYLSRYEGTPEHTRGILQVAGGGFECQTIEPPWKNNRPFESCIPAGNYICLPYTGDRWGPVYAMIGGVVGLDKEKDTRWACLIHPANYAHQLEGCIALGNKTGQKNGHAAVWNSKDTLSSLKNFLQYKSFLLTIRWQAPEKYD